MSAELLRRAATTLDTAASLAAGGPWTCSAVWSPDSHATSAVYSSGYPTGTIESEVVASGRKKRQYGGIRNPHNAAYITLMQPRVAGAIAVWLEGVASSIEQNRPSAWEVLSAVAVAEAILLDELAAEARREQQGGAVQS